MKALISLWPVAMIAAACGAVSAPEVGDPARGGVAYQKCYSCHALEPGRNDLGGPTLHKVVGRHVAAETGFDYSPAMRGFAGRHPRWTPELLDRLIADPETLVPGTSMIFTGISDEQERRDLIAYLERGGDRTP